jgi:ABC-type Fe3+-hydroxamate transport system substrate-binding protein
MKKVSFILFGLLLLTGCTNNGAENDAAKESSTEKSSSQVITSEQEQTTAEKTTADSTNVSVAVGSSSQSSTSTQEMVSTENTGTTTSDHTNSDEYYTLIHDAWQKQKDYVDSITDAKVKQSVQTPFSAANWEASRLEMENAENSEALKAIKIALTKVVNGQ